MARVPQSRIRHKLASSRVRNAVHHLIHIFVVRTSARRAFVQPFRQSCVALQESNNSEGDGTSGVETCDGATERVKLDDTLEANTCILEYVH